MEGLSQKIRRTAGLKTPNNSSVTINSLSSMELRRRCLVQESLRNITQQPWLAMNRTLTTRNQSLTIERITLLQSEEEVVKYIKDFKDKL